MLLLGLTGSIATGKSTVSSILSSPPYSLPIVDADKIARDVVEPGTPGYNKIVSHFSSSTPDLLLPPDPGNGGEAGPKGNVRPLNRPALGRRVFGQGSEKDRQVLNSIVHPAVRSAIYRQILGAYLRGSWAVVLDVPLLFESGWEPLCGTLLVVGVRDPEVQMKRLMKRDEHLTREDARDRVAAQWDVRDKAARAEAKGEGRGVVVWNDGDLEQLKRNLATQMEKIRSRSPKWWAWLLLINPPLMAMVASWNYLLGWWQKRQWEKMKAREKAKL